LLALPLPARQTRPHHCSTFSRQVYCSLLPRPQSSFVSFPVARPKDRHLVIGARFLSFSACGKPCKKNAGYRFQSWFSDLTLLFTPTAEMSVPGAPLHGFFPGWKRVFGPLLIFVCALPVAAAFSTLVEGKSVPVVVK